MKFGTSIATPNSKVVLQIVGPRLVNLGLRVFALGSKFALIIVLARLLDPVELGLYGLLVGTVAFSTLVIGGDYYTYSQRELLSEGKERWSFVLQHHAIAMLLIYVVLLPAQLLIFLFDLIPSQWAIWYFVLLVAEHQASEINRFLVAMQRQLLASAVLFVRMGVWVWVILPLMWWDANYRDLEVVFTAWLLGCLLAIVLGAFVVWSEARPWRRWCVDWNWLRNGFTVGALFLTATLCFRGLQTFDRYAVEALGGAEFLGVYVLYMAMAMAVIGVLEPAVFSFLYPKLVSAYRQGDMHLFKKLMGELALSSSAVSILVGLVISFLAPWLLDWIGKPLYAEYLHILWLLLLMTFIYAVGMVPHYALYARGKDKAIVVAHLGALAVFVIVLALTAQTHPFEATALALVAAFSWMGVYKYWCYRETGRQELALAAEPVNQEPSRV